MVRPCYILSNQTKKLLKLSGIGNQTHLQSFGIETIVDLPGVGQNLIGDVA